MEKIVFVNPTDYKKKGKAQKCDCRMEISNGYGEYADVYTIILCNKHKEKL